jgi:hypothetical protein
MQVRVKVTLRPTVGRPVRLGVKCPSGIRDQFSFLLEIFIRQLQLCYFVAPCLARGRVCNLLLLLVLASSVPLGSALSDERSGLAVMVTMCCAWQVVSAFLPMGLQRAVSQSRKSSKDDYGPTKLQYPHIEGSLYLLYMGLAISTLTFIGEIVYNKFRPGTSPSE